MTKENVPLDLNVFICLRFIYLDVYMNAGIQGVPEEGIGFPGAAVKGGFEPPDMGAKIRTQVLCESSQYS